MIATLAELDRVRDECRRMVTTKSLLSAGASVVPIPGLDIAADVGLLTTLLPQISARFGLDHDQVEALNPHASRQILVVAAGMGNHVIGRAVTRRLAIMLLRRMGVRIAAGSVARYVPLLGSAVAATISFGAMKMVGDAHIEDCCRTLRQTLLAPAAAS